MMSVVIPTGGRVSVPSGSGQRRIPRPYPTTAPCPGRFYSGTGLLFSHRYSHRFPPVRGYFNPHRSDPTGCPTGAPPVPHRYGVTFPHRYGVTFSSLSYWGDTYQTSVRSRGCARRSCTALRSSSYEKEKARKLFIRFCARSGKVSNPETSSPGSFS